jgi:uncharacterized protein with HEPN domain
VSRDALLFLEDIEKSCLRIVRYTEDRSRDEVFSDEIRFDAVLFNLQILGEAIKKLPFDLRQRYPEVPWREIAGLRDFVAHAYFALDLEILWNAIAVYERWGTGALSEFWGNPENFPDGGFPVVKELFEALRERRNGSYSKSSS